MLTTDVPSTEVFARTATVDGAGTGTIAAGMRRITVTSGNAAHIIKLPPPKAGDGLILTNGATAYKLRSSAPATIGIQGGVGAAVGSTIPANATVYMYCASKTSWVGFYHTPTAIAFVPVAA
jgi:hypothetical protein